MALTKPELTLPAVLIKSNINWATDFAFLYKTLRKRNWDERERLHMRFLLEIMPYLCTKIQLKDFDMAKMSSQAESVANAKMTSDLIKALEAENSSEQSPETKGS